MASYKIVIKRSATKEIERLSRKKDRKRVVERIAALADEPRPPGCVKLSGRDAHRVHRGPYRIVYIVDDDRLIIQIVKVGHRRDVYRP